MSSSRSSSSEDSYSDGISGGAATACWEGSASLTDRPSSQHSGQGHRVEVIANPIEAEGQGEVPVYKRIHRDASDPGRKVRFAEEGYSHRASRKMRPNHKKRSRSGKSGRAKRRRSNKLVISGDGGRESEVTSSDEDNASLTARCISLALGPSQNTVALVGFRSLVGYLLSVVSFCGSERDREREKERERVRETERDRQACRQRGRQRETNAERERQRETNAERERQRGRQRGREREREREIEREREMGRGGGGGGGGRHDFKELLFLRNNST